ncbi:winged helix-turn-helix transcriptional regulator [Bradyrhizobium jicamae]|uniref:Winged helix-turn-helix transcriptional regulator n=1 Tax=Bradyrhizobium jicamae TaxID=280332 RepID=A0ABS5FP05_9BRAD|nr:MarR family winged helix-turn-helix transcriptional regulator [Bradyrhizobium jicamae]MBR0798384.1 winged helix-turn-helix transcriptional regulator [Bradyrhizobium jicamae]MBR0936300.1 winged helix-turn-helix transcriptional regulator [Bradyrhizobium jicamae]
MTTTEPTRCNLTALRKATRRVSQLYDALLAPSGLRGTQRGILVHVARSGAPTMSELAAALVLDRTALNHNLKPLQRDGLVTVTVDKDDRRSRLVRLTKRGEARLAETRTAWQQAQERFETAFGAKQAADLRQTLELVASLEFGEAPVPSRALK